jgi:hypothetical protein
MDPRSIELDACRKYFVPGAMAAPVSLWRLRQPKEAPGGGRLPDIEVADQDAESPQEEAYIICRQCHQAVTRNQERFSIQGSHRHTFANPQGLVFEIGCFRSAIGCGYAGRASDEFTWFAGYRWRVCFCTSCLAHLGWLFTSTGGDAFHGLILERLIEPE